MQQYKNILVAIDGSYESELAFQKAIIVAKRNEANLHLVHIVDTRAFQNISSFDSAMVEQVSKTAEQTLEEYATEAKNNGVNNVSFSIEYGSPKTIIAHDLPKSRNIDLIIIGATGLNAVERLLIGSVTEYVTHYAICDVLVIRTDLKNQPVLNDESHKNFENKFKTNFKN